MSQLNCTCHTVGTCPIHGVGPPNFAITSSVSNSAANVTYHQLPENIFQKTNVGEILSTKTIEDLEAIGINVDDWAGRLDKADAVQILAFTKFLAAGTWEVSEDGERRYVVDQKTYEYGIGAIEAEEYLEC